MLEVKPNKEILKIHVSFMGASLWQIAWMLVGIAGGSFVYLLLPLPSVLRVPVMIPVVIFIASIGIVNYNGMNIFKLIRAVFRTGYMNRHPLVVRGRKEELYAVDDNK